jgi:hypothetical protein
LGWGEVESASGSVIPVAYRATRPKVERKLARLMRRKPGDRRARVRGTLSVRHDFARLAEALNLARLAKLCVAG